MGENIYLVNPYLFIDTAYVSKILLSMKGRGKKTKNPSNPKTAAAEMPLKTPRLQRLGGHVRPQKTREKPTRHHLVS